MLMLTFYGNLDNLYSTLDVGWLVMFIKEYLRPEVQLFLTKYVHLKDFKLDYVNVFHFFSTPQDYDETRDKLVLMLQKCFPSDEEELADDLCDLFLLEQVLSNWDKYSYLVKHSGCFSIKFYRGFLSDIKEYLTEKYKDTQFSFNLEKKRQLISVSLAGGLHGKDKKLN